MFENKTISFKEAEDYHKGLIMLTNAVEASEKGVGLDLTYKLIQGLWDKYLEGLEEYE